MFGVVDVVSLSPALYLVWQCCAYSQYKVQNYPGIATRWPRAVKLLVACLLDKFRLHICYSHNTPHNIRTLHNVSGIAVDTLLEGYLACLLDALLNLLQG